MIMIAALLVCCSLLRRVRDDPVVLMRSENLARPKSYSKSSFGGSRVTLDIRLPWYTSGFE